MIYDICQSPIGQLTIASDGEHITELHIEGDRYFTAVPRDWARNTQHPLLQRTRQQLAEYFAGTRSTFDLPLRPHGTAFQRQVWQLIDTIPKGQTKTYLAIARAIGRPRAARAVGSAVGRNPLCLLVPCHRVLASDGSLGGFVAGIERKQHLLAFEGAAA